MASSEQGPVDKGGKKPSSSSEEKPVAHAAAQAAAGAHKPKATLASQPIGKATTATSQNADESHLKEIRRRKSTAAALHNPNMTEQDLRYQYQRRMSHDMIGTREFLVDVEKTWQQVLEQEDTDGDCKITVLDQGPKVISLQTLRSGGATSSQVRGTYALSILLQELALARDLGHKRIILEEAILRENPVDRLSRLIREMFWDGLRRSVDEEGIHRVTLDPKNSHADHSPRIYVPCDDPLAFTYFTALSKRLDNKLEVVVLPRDITPEYVRSINMRPGILSLALRRRAETLDVGEEDGFSSGDELGRRGNETVDACACSIPVSELGGLAVTSADTSRRGGARSPVAVNLDPVPMPMQDIAGDITQKLLVIPATTDTVLPAQPQPAAATENAIPMTEWSSTRPSALLVSEDDVLELYEGVPFIVPGGRFNEMYGWDSYFEALGLICDGHVEMARGMVDNFVYEINHYHKILNANRSYYLTRSQPPFLTDMILQVFRRLSPDRRDFNCRWLTRSLRAAIKEYRGVWMKAPGRLTPETGLSRFREEGIGMPPETEPTHFNAVMAVNARKYGMEMDDFCQAYNKGEINVPELDEYFEHDRSLRESGHDTTYRLDGRSANLNPVDLNALLYRYEIDIAETIRDLFGGRFVLADGTIETPETWFAAAQRRKEAVPFLGC